MSWINVNNLLPDLIFNDTNFCPFSLGKKSGFFKVRVRVKVMDAHIRIILIIY